MKIAQVLSSQSWGEVTPETIERGLGGRETAMLKLAEVWADAGHQVTNFVNVERGKRFYAKQPEVLTCEGGGRHGGFHEYLPINMTRSMLANMPWDGVVAWEIPSVFADDIIRENIKVKICEMQVAHFPKGEMEAAEEFCDYVAALSPWHAGFLVDSGLEMKRGEIVSLPNGVDLTRYPGFEFNAKRNKYKPTGSPKFIYSSSPDRGLWHILTSWKDIRKSFAGAEIFITYGLTDYVDKMKWAHTRQAQMCIELEDLIQQPGVHNIGKVGQAKLASMQMEADAWLYPLDALWPTETGCITAVENAAAGNPLIISTGDCLEEEFGDISYVIDLPFNQDDFIVGIEKVIGDRNMHREMQEVGRKFAESRSWRRIGKKWLDLFATARS